MQNFLKSNEWRKVWVHKTFKIEAKRAEPNNSDNLQNLLPPEFRYPSLFFRNLKTLRKLLLDHVECIEI